ncbi:MAG: hypothetical protein WBX25_13375 [Rhodomicrobium sp.]
MRKLATKLGELHTKQKERGALKANLHAAFALFAVFATYRKRAKKKRTKQEQSYALVSFRHFRHSLYAHFLDEKNNPFFFI